MKNTEEGHGDKLAITTNREEEKRVAEEGGYNSFGKERRKANII